MQISVAAACTRRSLPTAFDSCGAAETLLRGGRGRPWSGDTFHDPATCRCAQGAMQRALSFPLPAERSRTKGRLEASLVGLCELELRKQRQEALVLGALALGDPPGAERAPCFSSWRRRSRTRRRQLVRTSRVPSCACARKAEIPA